MVTLLSSDALVTLVQAVLSIFIQDLLDLIHSFYLGRGFQQLSFHHLIPLNPCSVNLLNYLETVSCLVLVLHKLITLLVFIVEALLLSIIDHQFWFPLLASYFKFIVFPLIISIAILGILFQCQVMPLPSWLVALTAKIITVRLCIM